MTRHRYTVGVEPRRHQLHLTLELDGLPPGALRLAVPTWVPGAYTFLRFGRDVLWLKAEDASNGQTLSVTRDGWSGWRVENAPTSVRVTAQLNAWDPGTGELTGLVDDRCALLVATRYPFAPAHPGPCDVEYRLPEGWPLHHPAGALQLGPCLFRYESHAALLDAPVVAGAFTRATRAVRGTAFHAVFLSLPLGYEEEGASFLDGLARVAEGCHDIFGSFPFTDYTFVFDTSAESGWGMEGGFNRSSQHLDGEELRWEQAGVDAQIVLGVRRCVRRDVQQRGGASIDSGSGKRSPTGRRAKMLRSRRVCPRVSGRGGSAKVVACRRQAWHRCWVATYRLPSEKKWRSCGRSALAFGRSPVESVVLHRRSPESYAGTPPPVVADSSIGRPPPSGTQIGKQNARRWRSF